MSQLSVEMSDNRRAFEPGEEISGAVSWELQQPPRSVELRLFWFTRGKGTEDAGVVETVAFERPSAQETRSFRLRLPEAPYSFSGRLISLIWALELVAAPSKEVARVELVMAPGGQEVRLESLPENRAAKGALVWSNR